MHSAFKIKDIPGLFKTAAKEWWEKDPFRQSAVIAYYAIFSLPALLVLVITAVGVFYNADTVNDKVLSQVSDTMGTETADQVKEMLNKAGEAKTSIWATILGIITVLVGATGVFVELQKTMNIIWEVKVEAKNGIWPLIKNRLFSFGLILAIAFLLLISLVISTVLSAFSEFIQVESNQFVIVLLAILNFLISILVISTLFASMFKILPDAKITWRQVAAGSIVTGILFTIGKMAIALYFSKAEPGSGYGAAGSIILILLWTSYSSMILFYGAEFTRAFANKYSGYIAPSEHAKKATSPAT